MFSAVLCGDFQLSMLKKETVLGEDMIIGCMFKYVGTMLLQMPPVVKF
jgi:hypothetical protein